MKKWLNRSQEKMAEQKPGKMAEQKRGNNGWTEARKNGWIEARKQWLNRSQEKWLNRSEETMAEQKLEKWQNRSQEKGVLWTPMNHISNIPFNFCQKKIAIKNVLRYKHKIKSENKWIIFLTSLSISAKKNCYKKCVAIQTQNKKWKQSINFAEMATIQLFKYIQFIPKCLKIFNWRKNRF